MSASFRDSTLGMPEFAAESATQVRGEAGLEEEVVGLFELFRNRLLHYLMALGLSAQDGEEVIQEVFLSLFQHLRQSKPRHNLRGWIFRVGHNLGLKQRHRMRKLMLQPREAAEGGEGRQDLGPNPEEQVLAGERQERLRAVVDALPEQDRYCLYLRAEGLRYREIAEALDISLGAVPLSLGRSFARLARVDGR
jgi:RNA polymerase sigma-70 factor (ECF subfamily)